MDGQSMSGAGVATERKTEKRAVAKKAVVKKAAARATKASAKLENRQVPASYVRSTAVKTFLATRQPHKH
jgi:hypothetical protein